MDRVEKLAQSRGNLSVKYIEFMQILSHNKIPVFFEGDDQKYYMSRLSFYLGTDCCVGVNCVGKKRVLELNELIRNNETYKNSVCLFFLDADFDNNESLFDNYNIYITPCYSIENLYISERVFEKIISTEFGLSTFSDLDNKRVQELKSNYKNALSSYLNEIEEFNCLIREMKLSKYILNLNNIKFDELLRVDLNSCTKIYSADELKIKFKKINQDKNIDVDIEASRVYFSNKEKIYSFRGKQHMNFFVKFINKLVQHLNETKGEYESKKNFKVSEDNFLSLLSQYAETPECLVNFLQKFSNNNLIPNELNK